MAKNNIILTRIDNRLIHGQIVCNWAGTVGANLIVVVDDETANSDTEKSIMQLAASSLGFSSRFFTVQHTIDVIDKASDEQKILLVCKTPQVVRKLIEGGVEIHKVNIGNMHFQEGKEKISDKVYVDEKELNDLNYIKEHVEEIYIQDTPDYKKEEF